MSDKTFEKRKKIIYDFICDDMYVPMKFKEMAMVLQVNKEQRDELRQVLESLEEEGKICLSKRGKYCKGEAKRLQGTYRANQRGFGFVIIPEEDQDIFIGEDDAGGALDGDTVEVIITKASDRDGKRREGKIVKIVRVVKKELTVPKVTQYYYEVKPKNKLEVMCRLLDLYDPKLSVVFCNTKKQVDELVQGLQGRGYFAEGLHGDLKQEQRDRVMRAFRTGRTDILVATDVAARGIDVDDVEAVFNYDVPQDDEYYVHRIGRTGRAGREGKAFNLVVGKEVYKLREIQRYCKTRIIPQAIPSLDDVTSIKADKILDQVGEVLQDSDLSKVIDIVEKRVLEEDYTTLDLAAALLKMMMGEEGEELLEENRPLRELEDLEDESRRSRGGRNGRGSRGRNEDVARLFINIGKNQGIRPGDILGAIAGESGMPGRMVGSIDMFDNYTFVEVPREHADVVLQAMRGAKIKGKNVHMEKANRK